MQRDTVGTGVDRRHELSRDRQAERGAGHGRGLVQAQAWQPDFLGQPLGQQPGPQVTQRQAGIQLVAAVRARDQHGPVRDPARQMAKYVEAELVGPVQVLQDDQHREAGISGDEQVGEVLDQQAAAMMRVTGVSRERPDP